MKRAIVLGGGMIGSTMAMDLARGDLAVTVADARAEPLARVHQRTGARTVQADLSDPAAVRELVQEHDIVLDAMPSALGMQTLRAVIEAGRPCCDITFMPESPKDLDALAIERGVCAVVDMGVGPGMTNMLAGHAAASLSPCDSIRIYIGGVPAVRRRPFEFKVGFAPGDAIEEYTRPARSVEHGAVVVKDALSEVELIDFPGVGTLEAFNTDGLRTLVDNLDVPDLTEKTMRWPGHAKLMRVFRQTGLFGTEPVEVDGAPVVPLHLTAKLLFPFWRYEEGEEDLTVMRLIAVGTKAGRRVRITWDMVDRYDAATDTRSMSRTTAFPATIMARLILEGRFCRPGVHAPEVAGREPGLLDAVVTALAERGVRYRHREETLEA